ncbi:zf-C3HC-domain-containing protein [Bimuria novae-zelandiae CBS 107.79]|uniref:Zf-C3HC-domain-containing protein n=1 Tax=Bimuria novae-zelandiae CBS 107.79 TaxID=1447943 RepID=A0A6A5VL66_9PLEO|nr:zf-C3HC-domain-containing protein [Bimuria novae-zelandiae CBS 107.79]
MASSPSPPQEPALATTKRKFDLLLDKLQNASTTSLTSTLRESNGSTTSLTQPTTPEPASKRHRLSDIGMDRSRQASGSERIQQIKSQLLTPRKEGVDRSSSVSPGGVRVVGQQQTSTTPRKPANYQPYSQEQFLARLKTFADVRKWTNKPDALCEVEWAKRGWSCESWNTVACRGGCEKRLVVRLRPKRKDTDGKELDMSEDLTAEVDKALVDKYQEFIVDAHDQDCLWRKRGCQDDIYHIPIPNRAKSTPEFLARYRSFRSIVNDLPILENLIYPDPRVDDILKRVPTSFFNPPGSEVSENPPTTPAEVVSFLFAVFGWSGVSEAKIAMAVCGHCHQRVGLWLCKDDRLKEMSKKLDVPIETLRLNLVESHREHCPWKNPETQHNPTDGAIANMAGWQTQEFMILGTRKDKKEKDLTHTRNIESVDLGSEVTYPRGSMDSEPAKDDNDEELHSRWKRLKAKLKRTASKKSMRSTKSVKSTKSGKSVIEKE